MQKIYRLSKDEVRNLIADYITLETGVDIEETTSIEFNKDQSVEVIVEKI